MNAEDILGFIGFLVYIYAWLIFARAILSWFPSARGSAVVEILHQITDPLLIPLSRVIPRIGMIDISTMVAFIALQFIAALLGNPVRLI